MALDVSSRLVLALLPCRYKGSVGEVLTLTTTCILLPRNGNGTLDQESGDPDEHCISVLIWGKLLKCILLNTFKTLGYVFPKVCVKCFLFVTLYQNFKDFL